MRSIKLRPAVAAGATLLALAPVAASAAGGHPSSNRQGHAGAARCHVSLFAEPHIIASGEAAEVFGQLGCPAGASTANQAVTLYGRSPGSGYKVIATLSAGAGGSYSLKLPSIATETSFYARALGARSATRHVRVAPVVTFAGVSPSPGAAAPTSTVLRTGARNSVTFTGSVSPADTGAVVVLQRESQSSFEEWKPIERATIAGPGTTFTIRHTFALPGDANLRVLVRRHGSFSVPGTSEPISYSISQPQNPKLTLEPSPNPVSSGSPVTLKGVLRGGANQKVVLLSRTKGQALTKTDETTTSASGAYTFTEKPLRNTFYRATAPGASSTSQFEGVKYVLAAAASAAKVQAGQALTFSGTVSPIAPGHPVYLERQNGSGGGFHVVDVATVGTDGAFSINRALFGAGTAVLRVHVPGGPENAGASSSTFNVEITPAPPGTLHPVPLAKLPSEGKV
ncbi:MAG: hypothetical protein JWO23_762 [Solirubrobacterales bacterium]|nr:hypothetical protein [Solirubrobacterales bacterium]